LCTFFTHITGVKSLLCFAHFPLTVPMYSAVSTFDWEENNSPAILSSNLADRAEHFVNEVRKRIPAYQTKHILIPCVDALQLHTCLFVCCMRWGRVFPGLETISSSSMLSSSSQTWTPSYSTSTHSTTPISVWLCLLFLDRGHVTIQWRLECKHSLLNGVGVCCSSARCCTGCVPCAAVSRVPSWLRFLSLR
jgi:hypothetical protein